MSKSISLLLPLLKNIKAFYMAIFIAVLVGFLSCTQISLAQGGASSGGKTGGGASSGGPTVQPTSLVNPLNVNTIEELLVAILTVIQIIAMPIVIFFIVYAGFLYVTARGNAEQTQKATRALLYAVIGGVIIVGALVIGEIIKNFVTSF